MKKISTNITDTTNHPNRYTTTQPKKMIPMNELYVTFPKSLEITLDKSESETVSTKKEITTLHLYKNGTI